MTQANIARSTSERENVSIAAGMSVCGASQRLATVDVNRDSQGEAVDGGAVVQAWSREKEMASPVSEYQLEI